MRTFACLILLTLGAICVHGYHVGAEDQAIYLPAVKESLNPALYPHDSAFFMWQTKWTVFDELVAAVAQHSGLPLEWVLFATYMVGVFFVLSGGLAVSRRLFQSPVAQWGGVVMVAAVMTIPVAGTLALMVDPYLHPRIFGTGAALFALAAILDGKLIAVAWLALGMVIHPQVTVFAMAHLVVQALPERVVRAWVPAPAMSLLVPAGAAEAWEGVMTSRRHHFPLRWNWYEWLGAIGPVLLFAWFAKLAMRAEERTLARVASRFALSATLGTLVAVAINVAPGLQRFMPIQPMRHLHIVFLIMFLAGGGLLAQFVLQEKAWRWAVVFVPLAAGMFTAQIWLFGWNHIEWPERRPQNEWLQAFLWVRENTPRDAYFALDSRYMAAPGQYNHGFRAWAERSAMADAIKDRGVAALFPDVANQWRIESIATQHLDSFARPDFLRLRREFGVTWVVTRVKNERGEPHVTGLDCPYVNSSMQVCKVD